MRTSEIDPAQERPVFIVGSKRGGTTLLRRIVDAHSQIAVPSPGWFYHFVYPHLYSYGDLTVDANILALIADCLEMPTVNQFWGLRATAAEVLELLYERSFRAVFATLSRLACRSDPGEVWGAKTPGNVFWIPEIQRDFPHARFVLLYRDGRDVATDLLNTSWGPPNVYTATELWRHYTAAMRRAEATLRAGSYHVMKYEHMVTEPEQAVARLCEFLQVSYEPKMLRYYERSDDAFLSQSYHQDSGKPITDRFVGIFRALPELERRTQVTVAGKLLSDLGYEPDVAPREIGFWERERYLEELRHGGQILTGGVQYKHKRLQQRQNRFADGVWTNEDAAGFVRRSDRHE